MSTETTIKLTPGRPILPNSARQLKLQAAAERVARGEITRKGRPVNPSSKRQQETLQKQQIIASGGQIKPGRPKATTSPDIIVGSIADIKTKVDVAPTEEAEVLVG